MLVALISDVHDHLPHLLLALQQAKEAGCSHLLCMGDITSLSTFRTLCDEWPHGIDIVFGNNEYGRHDFLALAAKLAKEGKKVHHHGDNGIVVLDGRRLFISHYPHAATRALDSGEFDAVFFGHTHLAESFSMRQSIAANPGEVCGLRHPASYGIYNTNTNQVHTYNL